MPQAPRNTPPYRLRPWLPGAVLVLTIGLDAAAKLTAGLTRDFATADLLSGAVIACLLPALLLRHAGVAKGCLLLALLNLWIFIGVPRSWPYHFLEPLAGYALIVLLIRPLRSRPDWLRPGRLDRLTGGLMLATILLAAAALAAWLQLTKPDLSDIRDGLLAQAGGHLLLFGLLFACANALLEEIVWRGILTDALRAGGFGPAAAILLQSASFGIAHIHGFPRGLLGVAMAGLYGVVLGIIRQRSGSLAAPTVTHIAADATIFILLVRMFA